MLCLSGFELYSRWVPLLNLLFPFAILLVTLSPRASSLEHSGGGAGKRRRACN